MLIYLDHAYQVKLAACQQQGRAMQQAELYDSVIDGAAERLRPKMMTVAAIMAGLLPIMWSDGTGSEVMRRIAAPMVGGMVTAPLLSMLVIPAAWYLLHRKRLGRTTPLTLPAWQGS